MARKTIKVVERKLGKEQALGLSYGGKIEIDPRQDAKEYSKTLIHELLHEAMPYLDEDEVIRVENIIAKSLWEQGYRKVSLK
jgi:hypothetical protein